MRMEPSAPRSPISVLIGFRPNTYKTFSPRGIGILFYLDRLHILMDFLDNI